MLILSQKQFSEPATKPSNETLKMLEEEDRKKRRTEQWIIVGMMTILVVVVITLLFLVLKIIKIICSTGLFAA